MHPSGMLWSLQKSQGLLANTTDRGPPVPCDSPGETKRGDLLGRGVRGPRLTSQPVRLIRGHTMEANGFAKVVREPPRFERAGGIPV